jgi:pimeloyl-ACP methyl ester carboxylesterase
MTRIFAANDTTVPPPTHIGGQGSPLILLHGIGGTWEIWKPVLPALEARHRVIAMTIPGHHGGPTCSGSGDATIAGLADQIVSILRAQGIERAHVAGYSFDGWLSIELARRGFARSVVAFSPAGGWRSHDDYVVIARSFRILYELVDVVRFLLAPITHLGWIRKILGSRAMEHAERVPHAEFRAFLRAISHAIILPGLLRTMGRDGPVAVLQPDNIPIRIAWCGCDRVIPFRRYGEPFVERIQGAEVIMLPDVGHVPIYDDPEQVAAHILSVTTAVDGVREVAK